MGPQKFDEGLENNIKEHASDNDGEPLSSGIE